MEYSCMRIVDEKGDDNEGKEKERRDDEWYVTMEWREGEVKKMSGELKGEGKVQGMNENGAVDER